MQKIPILCFIVPCFNEEEIIDYSANMLIRIIKDDIEKKSISEKSFICFVDDGSKDLTWDLIENLSNKYSEVKGIKLSGNFGHQNALIAGLFNNKNKADCFITIDADLQDDLDVIDQMIEKYKEGNKVVYGIRSSRHVDTFFNRINAWFYYNFIKKINKRSIKNHADFRLADAEVIEHLQSFGEVNLYLRGIFPLIGFKSDYVYYVRRKRIAGKTKYPFLKLVSLAWQGITSFSTFPLRVISYLGFLMFFVSIILSVWAFISYFTGDFVKGWTSMVILMLLFLGINMICLGVIGEYIGKIYNEVKARPRYIIEKQIN